MRCGAGLLMNSVEGPMGAGCTCRVMEIGDAWGGGGWRQFGAEMTADIIDPNTFTAMFGIQPNGNNFTYHCKRF